MNDLQVFSREKRWHLVDFQQMSAMFYRNEHLRDNIHPTGWFSQQIFNIYLNIHRQHHQGGGRRLRGEDGRKATPNND